MKRSVLHTCLCEQAVIWTIHSAGFDIKMALWENQGIQEHGMNGMIHQWNVGKILSFINGVNGKRYTC